MALRIGLTYNVKSEVVLKPGDPPDLNAELDHEETVAHIERALKEAGHDVARIGGARNLLQLNGQRPDIVFNIAEGYEGRNRESQVPILLEMMQIPYVGADGLTLGLTLDKVLTKKVLIAEHIPTPRYAEVSDPEKLWSMDLAFPLIVKLRCEGSSKGLSEKSLVNTPEELQRQVRWLMETYKGSSVFIEEFIEGNEFTVAIIGNDPSLGIAPSERSESRGEHPEAYPVCQISLDGQTELGRKFFHWAYLRSGADYICPAKIPEPLAKKMQELARRTYQSVDCRDFGRVDFRVDKRGNPYVLEINPLPSLSTEDVFNFIAKTRGLTHYQIINRILDAALVRTGLAPQDEARALSPTSR